MVIYIYIYNIRQLAYYSPADLAGLIRLKGLLTWLHKLILLFDNG